MRNKYEILNDKRIIKVYKDADNGVVSKLKLEVRSNNEENVKQDIIQSGWGNPQGYEIGGKDFSQVLNLKAIFSLECK